jgi:ribA/ribD-fused uncharacterized protein
MTAKVESFTGRYRFLSNFYPCKIMMDDKGFPSIEHAYQARKTDSPEDRERIRTAKTAGQAKRLGRKVTIVPNWLDIRVDCMRRFLFQKFSDKALAAELLDTGDAELVELNSWGDIFWGVSGGRGDNMLGKLLMEVREKIRKEGIEA